MGALIALLRALNYSVGVVSLVGDLLLLSHCSDLEFASSVRNRGSQSHRVEPTSISPRTQCRHRCGLLAD